MLLKALIRTGVALLFITLAGCDSVEDQPVDSRCETGFEPKAFDHHVIGFYPSYKHSVLPVSEIRWDKLTRVIYAFAIPQADGTLDVSALTQVDALATAAHAQGVEVYVSVGGGGGSGNFPILAQNAATRSTFVQSVLQFVNDHCLDGVDIDWESWTKDSSNAPLESEMNNFRLMMEELRSELDSKAISLDVYAGHWGGQHYQDVHHLVDYVHIMAYDFSGPWSGPGPHSSYSQAIGRGASASSTGLAYWLGYRKWPRSKIILGLPFYGRDFDDRGGAGIAYRDIVALDADAPDKDRVANIYYNGVQTITDKTSYVVDNNIPGVMIWEISHDTPQTGISLLEAIDQVANP